MSVAVTELPVIMGPPRKRWTRSEYHALASSGVLEHQRLELVEGDLISSLYGPQREFGSRCDGFTPQL